VERVVLVHGSVAGGPPAWSAQEPLAERWELVVLSRPGFPPGPAVERVDFEEHAALVARDLRPGDHLVGHSYGGVIALLAAAAVPDRLRSLTVIEPPATGVAAGHPAVDRFASDGAEWWHDGPRHDPEAFLRGFLGYVGSTYEPPSPLTPELEQGARTLIGERGPGRRGSHWTSWPQRRSRSSSSRAPTTRRSTRSATCWWSGSARSGS
jgi:pimeloyl-ACP methyl ester carboxylesterase